jgi:hypothetical protein
MQCKYVARLIIFNIEVNRNTQFMREPPLRKTWEYSNITQPLSSYERGMPGRSYQTKPGLPSVCQVNIKCFYAKSTCFGSNYRNINSLTLVQKVIPGYLQRTVANYSRAYLWLIPMIFRMVFPSCIYLGREYFNSVGENVTSSTDFRHNRDESRAHR